MDFVDILNYNRQNPKTNISHFYLIRLEICAPSLLNKKAIFNKPYLYYALSFVSNN
jgi:hypothetical protein